MGAHDEQGIRAKKKGEFDQRQRVLHMSGNKIYLWNLPKSLQDRGLG